MYPNEIKPPPLDDFRITHPEDDEITEELQELEGYREAQRHRDDDGNFGDLG